MPTVSSRRSLIIVNLLFAVPFAALGYRVANVWGLLAGIVVGAVTASRMMMRERLQSLEGPALIVTAGMPSTASDTRTLD